MQVANQAVIVKTVREQGTVFQLDTSVRAIFDRMRAISKKTLASLNPHPFYLKVSPNSLFATSLRNSI